MFFLIYLNNLTGVSLYNEWRSKIYFNSHYMPKFKKIEKMCCDTKMTPKWNHFAKDYKDSCKNTSYSQMNRDSVCSTMLAQYESVFSFLNLLTFITSPMNIIFSWKCNDLKEFRLLKFAWKTFCSNKTQLKIIWMSQVN